MTSRTKPRLPCPEPESNSLIQLSPRSPATRRAKCEPCWNLLQGLCRTLRGSGPSRRRRPPQGLPGHARRGPAPARKPQPGGRSPRGASARRGPKGHPQAGRPHLPSAPCGPAGSGGCSRLPAPEPAQRFARDAEPPGFPAVFTLPSYPRGEPCQAQPGDHPPGPAAGSQGAAAPPEGGAVTTNPLWGGQCEACRGCCRPLAAGLRCGLRRPAGGVPPRVAILLPGRSHFDAPVIHPPTSRRPERYAGNCEGPETHGSDLSRLGTARPPHLVGAHCRASGTSTTRTPSGGENRKSSSPRPELVRTSSKATRVTLPTRSKTAVSRTSPVPGSTRISRCS